MTDPSDIELLAQRLRQARASAGISQKDACRLAGVSRGSLGNWESGSAEISATRLLALARLYGVSADYLLGMSDHPQGLRVGDLIVDEDGMAEILGTRDPQAFRDMIHDADRLPRLWFVVPIPGRSRLHTRKEWKQRQEDLVRHARALGVEEVNREPLGD